MEKIINNVNEELNNKEVIDVTESTEIKEVEKKKFFNFKRPSIKTIAVTAGGIIIGTAVTLLVLGLSKDEEEEELETTVDVEFTEE